MKTKWQLSALKYVPLHKTPPETYPQLLTPVPYSGKVNKQKYVVEVTEFIAQVRHEPTVRLVCAATRNTKELLDRYMNPQESIDHTGNDPESIVEWQHMSVASYRKRTEKARQNVELVTGSTEYHPTLPPEDLERTEEAASTTMDLDRAAAELVAFYLEGSNR